MVLTSGLDHTCPPPSCGAGETIGGAAITCPNVGLSSGLLSVLRGQPSPLPVTSLDAFNSWVSLPLWATHFLRLSLHRARQRTEPLDPDRLQCPDGAPLSTVLPRNVSVPLPLGHIPECPLCVLPSVPARPGRGWRKKRPRAGQTCVGNVINENKHSTSQAPQERLTLKESIHDSPCHRSYCGFCLLS